VKRTARRSRANNPLNKVCRGEATPERKAINKLLQVKDERRWSDRHLDGEVQGPWRRLANAAVSGRGGGRNAGGRGEFVGRKQFVKHSLGRPRPGQYHCSFEVGDR